jgi:anti-sigma factor RsiW
MSPRTPAEVPCTEVVELVTAYLERALPPEHAEEIRAHLEVCPGCRAYLEQIRATIEALGSVPVETISEALSERACNELAAAFRHLTRHA